MSKRDEQPDNWQAFGLLLITEARNAKAYYDAGTKGGQQLNGAPRLNRVGAEQVLRLAGDLKLIDEEAEAIARMFGNRGTAGARQR